VQDYIKLAYEAGKQQAHQEVSANLEKLSQAAYEQGVAQALEDAGMSKEAVLNRLLRPTTVKQLSPAKAIERSVQKWDTSKFDLNTLNRMRQGKPVIDPKTMVGGSRGRPYDEQQVQQILAQNRARLNPLNI
jgi:hypothetical protein